MELSFSIREYTNSMRSSDMDKCWPFDPEEKNRSLPSMNVRKFRWWAQGLDRKVKQRSPKKRSITELFAMAPPISTVEARSEGPDEAHEQKLITPDQLSTETLTDDVEKKKPSKGKKRKRTIKAFESKSDEETIKERKKKEKKKKKKLKEKKLKKKKKLEVQIQCERKDNAGEPEPSKMETSSESTKRDIEVKTLSNTLITGTDEEKLREESDNAGEPEPSKMETSSESTKRDTEVKTLSNTLITGTDEEKLREEPDEALIPLISILKKCKRSKNHAKNGKGVTFSGIDAILGPDENTMACSVDPIVTFSSNEDKDTFSGIDAILGPDEDTMACSVDPLVTFSNNEDKDTFSGIDAILGPDEDTMACSVDPLVMFSNNEDKDTFSGIDAILVPDEDTMACSVDPLVTFSNNEDKDTFSGIDAILGPDEDTMACSVDPLVTFSNNEDKDTFSGIDVILGPDEDTMACSVDPLVTFSNNEDKDTSSKCIIDLNEALPEPIDLNSCLEDQFMEALNSTGAITGTLGSPKTDICHSSDGISSPPLNSPRKMCQPTSEFSKNLEPLMNINSDISTISMSAHASTEQPPMIPRTVRLMGKDVTVTSTDLKSVSTCNKAQETASSSHASSSYYSDGANNNNSNSTDNNNCLEMNFSTVQFAPGSYMPENYNTTNTTGSVISFPVVPGINFYHPQFPVVSPPMISFPLGGSVFPQQYGLNFSGFGDESYNREKSCREMGYMK